MTTNASGDPRTGMLYIFGGLPGTGKTTLSLQLAQEVNAIHVRIDTIEQALRECGTVLSGPEGYVVGYQIAVDNLRLGRDVVADSVNPLRVTREAWRNVAKRCNARFVEIETVCSNRVEHQDRIESRPTTSEPALRWQDVVKREYELWDEPHVVLDTANQSVADSYSLLQRLLRRG
ncbi:MAG: AAA family ATPase [Burkholderiales bacterium]